MLETVPENSTKSINIAKDKDEKLGTKASLEIETFSEVSKKAKKSKTKNDTYFSKNSLTQLFLKRKILGSLKRLLIS